MTIEDKQLIVAGKTERELNEEVFKLAKELSVSRSIGIKE